MSDDDTVRDLARRVGIAVEWTNAADEPTIVTVPVLRCLLAALGYPAGTSGEISASTERLEADNDLRTHGPVMTATVGQPIALTAVEQHESGTALLITESGLRRDVRLERAGNRLTTGAINEPGYHALHLRDRVITLAVAPKRCFAFRDIGNGERLWGVAVQLYGLRHTGDGGIGNTAGLSAFAARAAKYGPAAIALGPTHAMFSADLSRYGPYSPSNRLLLNPLYADPGTVFDAAQIDNAIQALGLAEKLTSLEAADLIDWPSCAGAKLAVLRWLFDNVRNENQRSTCEAVAVFRRDRGDVLEKHALFEVLHAARLADDPRCWNWRRWPKEWQDPGSAAVRDFAAANADEIRFHVFLQWLTDRSLAAAQAHSRAVGMKIGLIADLAVGTEAGGSYAWSCQRDLVMGLNVGAPPDLFNPRGQDWGLTAFSPRALAVRGFGPFIATLRAVLRNAGGIRIDHAMGLQRLWLVPEGASPADGAYLTYPVRDLVRLIKLESSRSRAIVIGEDLGTVPKGFDQILAEAGIDGMRVLWFERDGEEFRGLPAWPPDAAAMTSTHDLPTVAGWWRGTDIEARAQFGSLGSVADARTKENAIAQRRGRSRDRRHLWAAFRDAGVVCNQDVPEDDAEAVDAAIRFVAATPANLALIPLEDMLGLPDQPNLPGTVDQHPNWRRRYPGDAQSLFDAPKMQRRALFLRRRSLA
jgi:4-alpha-glucanotransferase